MISNELENLADRLLDYAAKGDSTPPEACAAMATALLAYADVVRVLETLPFDVTAGILNVFEGSKPDLNHE